MPKRLWLWQGPIKLLLLVSAVGCGSAAQPLVPVSGKVVYQGMTISAGTIVFTPDSKKGTNGPIAMGEIRVDGTYSLKTGKSFGAAAGWYRVTVAALGPGEPAPPGQRYHIPPSLLPEKYRDPDLSQLACQVHPNQANAIDFKLD
jgi:hypothetical protein